MPAQAAVSSSGCRRTVARSEVQTSTDGCPETVRHTEFWTRMDDALGPSYARSWARQHVLSELDGRTVEEAFAAGYDAKTIWRAVWKQLELPAQDR